MPPSAGAKAWAVGNVAAEPLLDGTSALAQVVSLDPGIKKAVTVAYFDVRLTKHQLRQIETAPSADHIVAIQFTERSPLTKGLWPVLCSASVNLAGIPIPFENTRSSGWEGARFYNSGVITLFLQMFFGIQPRDLMPSFPFESLLLRRNLGPGGEGALR